MTSSYGNNLKLTIFGASHDPEIGMILDGIPAGKKVDLKKLQSFLDRRAPGNSPWSTNRKEADIPLFQSGLAKDVTTGEPITAVIQNKNVRRLDYDGLKHIPRPGHADFTAWMKYGMDFDMSGGGPFSGRMTASICIAGGLCKQWLEEMGIRIGAHIRYIGVGKHFDTPFDALNPEIDAIGSDFQTIDPDVGIQIQDRIAQLQAEGDSAGGLIECAIVGLPIGLGSCMFGGVEGHIAQAIYGIPAVKELHFGNDSLSIDMLGSDYNDAFAIKNGKIVTETNNAGGILGGITNGMPVIFQVGFKPTPSISKPQKSVNLKTMEEVIIEIQGRHDPCIVPRAVPVVEAAAAIAIYDLILGGI